jgi:hypothetical protein
MRSTRTNKTSSQKRIWKRNEADAADAADAMNSPGE